MPSRTMILAAVGACAVAGAWWAAHPAAAALAGANGRIAFVSDRSGNVGVFVMNADGTSAVKRTGKAAVAGEPAWSPDGKRIAFTGLRGGSSDVFVMNADGGRRST